MFGLRDGMVMQRNQAGECEIYIESEADVKEASYQGSSGVFPLSLCKDDSGGLKLSGIPTGGPYTVNIGGRTFEDIYVGDVWILAGQSNMEGVGWLRAEDDLFLGDPAVRAFYMDDTWGVARHPLHDLGIAVDRVHEALGALPRPMYNSVGPGLAFALKMKALTGAPQGVLCCAHGGTSMEQWSPAIKSQGGDKSLYGAMLRRFRANGAHIAGMFWYQGCSDTTSAETCALFTDRMKNFVEEFRRDVGSSAPIVQVQIGRRTGVPVGVSQECWTAIREQQRTLHTSVSGLLTLSTVAKALDDIIHLSASAQDALGKEAAEAMYHQLYGVDGKACLPPPVFGGHSIRADGKSGLAVVSLRYQNLHGALVSGSRPTGFMITEPQGPPDIQHIFDTRLMGDIVELHTDVAPEHLSGLRLYYGYGADPYCNITDEAGRGIPAMGPIIL